MGATGMTGLDALGRAKLMARIGATYFGTGAVLAFLVAMLPTRAHGLSQAWLIAVAAIAGLSAVAMLVGSSFLSVGVMHLIVPGGTLLIALAVYHSGSLSTTAAVFFMTGTYPFTFFRRNVALAYLVLMGVSYAVVLAATDTSDADLSRWLLVMGTLLAIGLAFNWLVLRLESVQGELDELNRTLEGRVADGLRELRLKATEIEASRRRIVTAADTERRRLERNLHDGAQQHLVALAVNLRLIESVLEEDPVQAAELLEAARSAVSETVEEIRALAHGLYPATLVDHGLGAALSSVARRSPIPTTVETEALGRYDRDIEAAVYFCCLEAMQNAAKHAGDGAHIAVHLEEVDGELRFAVSDDGAGFELDAGTGGQGFVNMADRLGALGGRVEVAATRGRGTRVSGVVPASSRPPDTQPRVGRVEPATASEASNPT